MTTPSQVTEPGVFDLPAEIYHADPVPGGSLSSGGARKLLPPSCPAKFKWDLDHGRPDKPEFDFGHATHLHVLGAGPEVRVIDVDDWRTKDARAQLAEARAAGLVPVKQEEFDRVEEMAAAIRAHPDAGPLFEPGTGIAEQSLFWQDPEFGIWRRARPDWLPHWKLPDGRYALPDYKTCHNANPEDLRREMVKWGYDQQADWYTDAVKALGIADEVAFLFVFQEKTPPFVVTVVQPDVVALRRGRARNRKAMDIYRGCVERGIWPGYTEKVEVLPLPHWEEVRFEEEEELGVYDVLGESRWVRPSQHAH